MTHMPVGGMTPAELHGCGCERCQDALRIHALLDQLVESQDATLRGLEKLERAVDAMIETVRS